MAQTTASTPAEPRRRAATTVLIVEDDKASRLMLKRRLLAAGCDVTAVSCGQDAIAHCLSYPPDVLILDMVLPDMSGPRVCQTIRDTVQRPVAVIFVSGRIDARNAAPADAVTVECGGDYFLAKPYDPSILMALISEIGAALQREAEDFALVEIP